MQTEELKGLAVDFDGNMVRTNDLVCSLVNYRCGTNYKPHDITSWDYWTNGPHRSDFWAAFTLLDQTNLRAALKPYDSHVGWVLAHIADVYGLYVLSANEPIAEEGIVTWIRSHAPGASHHGFAVRCIGRKTAAEKASEPVKGFIDDNPNLAPHVDHVVRFESWAEVPALLARAMSLPGRFLLLANCPWNKEVVNKGAFA